MRHGHNRLLAIASIFLAAAALPAQQEGRDSGPAPMIGFPSATRAYLWRGTDPLRGLPFFAPNAIPALRGEYLIGPLPQAPDSSAGAGSVPPAKVFVPVWYTRETVVLGSTWKRVDFPPYRASILERSEDLVLALRSDRFSLFFELPEDSPDARRFAAAFVQRFSIFFDNAASDADLSFPASVDLSR